MRQDRNIPMAALDDMILSISSRASYTRMSEYQDLREAFMETRHRVLYWRRLDAEPRRHGVRRDALLLSVGVNGQHGRRRTNDDKRRSVDIMLRDPKCALVGQRDSPTVRRRSQDGSVMPRDAHRYLGKFLR